MGRSNYSKVSNFHQPEDEHFTSVVEAISNLLHGVKGDILYAILFLSVALMFQKLADGLIKSEELPFSPMYFLLYQLSILGFILSVCLLDLLFLSLVLLSLESNSLLQVLWGGSLIIAFTLAITMMGFVINFKFLFQAAFIASMIVAFGGFYSRRWNEEIDHSSGHVLALVTFLVTFPFLNLGIVALMETLGIFDYFSNFI